MEKILLTRASHAYFHGNILQMGPLMMVVQILVIHQVEIGVQQVWMEMEYTFPDLKNGDIVIHFAQYMLRKVSFVRLYSYV